MRRSRLDRAATTTDGPDRRLASRRGRTVARFGVLTPDFDPVPESELWAMYRVASPSTRVIFPCLAAFGELAAKRIAVVHPPWWTETANAQGRAYWLRVQGVLITR